MIYSMISFLETVLSIKRAQLTQRDITRQAILDLNKKKKELESSTYQLGLAAKQACLNQMKILFDDPRCAVTKGGKGGKFAYYGIMLNALNEDDEYLPFFKLHFEDFKKFVIRQRLENGKLNENDLVNYIEQCNAEIGSMPIHEYVNQFNNNFTKMTKEQHADFFFSLNRKLDGLDFETTKRLLTILSLQYIGVSNWKSFLANSQGELVLEDFIYLILHEIMDNDVNEKEVVFFENLIPEFKQATIKEKEERIRKGDPENNCTSFNFPQSFFDRLGDFALHSRLLMRILVLRNDLLDRVNINFNKCISQPDGSVMPSSFYILKMIEHDDVIYRNLCRAKLFRKADLSVEFLKREKIDFNKILGVLKATLIEKNREMLWDELNNLQFIMLDAEMKPKAESHYMRRRILSSWEKCAVLLAAQTKKKEPDNELQKNKKAMDDSLKDYINKIKDFFDAAKTDSFKRKQIMNDMDLGQLFGIQASGIYLPDNCLYSPKDLAKCIIDIIEASDLKDKIWDNILHNSSFLVKTRSANERARKYVFSLTVTFEGKYYAALSKIAANKTSASKKETVKKLTENEIRENKELIARQQKTQSSNLTPPASAPAKSPVKQVEQQIVDSSLNPLPEKEKTLTLSEDDKMTFELGIRAVMAGSPDVEIHWEQQDKEPGYFTVDFSCIGNTIKVNGGLNQTYWFAAFSAEKKKEFFEKYVLHLLQKKLNGDVSVKIENNIVKVIPKKQHCSYPDALHVASFQYLKNHVTVSACKTAGLALPVHQEKSNHKKLNAYSSSLEKPITSLIPDKKVAPSSPMVAVETGDPLVHVKTVLREAVADCFSGQEFHFLTMEKVKEKCIIKFNLKGTPCLSSNEQKKVDTYLVMKSLVATLQALFGKESAVIKPDTLDVGVYQNKKCEISINIGKKISID